MLSLLTAEGLRAAGEAEVRRTYLRKSFYSELWLPGWHNSIYGPKILN